MKKFLSYIQTTLSLIAIILSIVAISVTYPRSADSNLDYIGIIVGILGALVAILIGWQLYNALNLKELVIQTENAKQAAVEASIQANNMLDNTQALLNDISQRVTGVSARVDSLSDFTSKNLDHITGVSQTLSGLQQIVQKSLELYSDLQTRIKDLDEELGHKWDKADLQPMSDNDVEDIIKGIFSDNKPDDPTSK